MKPSCTCSDCRPPWARVPSRTAVVGCGAWCPSAPSTVHRVPSSAAASKSSLSAAVVGRDAAPSTPPAPPSPPRGVAASPAPPAPPAPGDAASPVEGVTALLLLLQPAANESHAATGQARDRAKSCFLLLSGGATLREGAAGGDVDEQV